MEKIETLQALVPRLVSYRERPAVVAFGTDRTETWSYGKLAEHAERLAAGLANAGFGKDTCIGLLADNSPQWFAACLGVLASGAIAVPLDMQLGEEALRHELRDSDVRVIFTTERLLKRVRQGLGRRKCEIFLLGESADGAGGWKDLLAKKHEAATTVSADDRAVLFYTSGTTGPPKGVPLTHRNLAFQLNAIATARVVTSEDRVLLPLPLHHVYPFTIGVLTTLALGLPIILPHNLTGPQLIRALREG